MFSILARGVLNQQDKVAGSVQCEYGFTWYYQINTRNTYSVMHWSILFIWEGLVNVLMLTDE